MTDGTVSTIETMLPERLQTLQRLSGLPVVFGGSTRPTAAGRQLTISRLRGTLSSALAGLRVTPGRGLGGFVVQHGTSKRVNDYASATAITHDYDDPVIRHEQITSVLAVPVAVNGAVVAILYGAVRGQQPIGDRALLAAEVVAGQLQRDLARPGSPRTRSPRSAAAMCSDAVTQSLAQLDEAIHLAESRESRDRLRQIYQDLAAFATSPAPQALPDTQPAISQLSARELDALRLVAVGASNLEIAAELRLSPETVKAYLRSAMRKLGARNRTAAVHAARLARLL